MTLCRQCNGNGNTIFQESSYDPFYNKESFHSPAPLTGNSQCTQCNGKGYY